MNLLLKSGREELALLVKSCLDSVLRKNNFENVRCFIMFLGFPRSGHSLVGSLLNQHPEILISHELDLLHYMSKYKCPKQLLFNLITNRERWFRTVKNGKWAGYNYSVDELKENIDLKVVKVIGDKKGGVSSMRLINNFGLIDELQSTVKLPLKFVFIVRNPFDNIATRITRESGIATSYRISNVQMDNFVEHYFKVCDLIEKLQQKSHDVYISTIEQFIAAPQEELVKLFKWVGITADLGLVEVLAKKINPNMSVTRNKVDWDDRHINEISIRAKKYPYLKNYSFD